MSEKLSYEELEQRIRELEKECVDHKRAGQTLQQSLREMAFLNNLVNKVSSNLSFDEVAHSALEGMFDILTPDLALLFLRNGDQLFVQREKFVNPKFGHNVTAVHKVGQCLCGMAVAERRAIYSKNIHNDPRCTWEECKIAGLISFAALPLLSGDEVLGLIALASATTYDFSEQSTLLETASNEIAIALQNSIYYKQLSDYANKLEQEITERKRIQEENLNRQQFLESVLFHAPDAIVTLDSEHRVIGWNPGAAKMFGYTVEEVIGAQLDDLLVRGERYSEAIAKTRQVLSGQQTEAFETVRYRKDGTPLRVIAAESPIMVDGVLKGFVAVYTDISERLRAEESIIATNRSLQTILDSIPSDVYVADMRTYEVLFMNAQMQKSFGTNCKGEVCWQAFRGGNGPCAFCTNLELLDNLGEPSGVKTWECHNPVNGKWYLNYDQAVPWLDGRYVRIQIAVDISERKQIEDALRESEEKFRTLVEQSPLGISLIGKDGRYKYTNPRFQEMFGYTTEDIPTENVWFEKAFPDKDYRTKALNTWFEDLKQTGIGQLKPHVYWVHCKDGSRKQIQFRPVSLDNLDQLVIYEDITEKMIMERQLQQAQKMEAVGTLAGGIAHDFNNMLTAILGRAEMILMEMKPEDPRHSDLEEIHRAASRSADLTRQLLAFARKQAISPKVLELNDTVEASLKMLRRLIGENIDLVWQPDTNLWSVEIDPSQVDQILTNLCVNARDAISGTGKVTIETKNVLLDQVCCTHHAGFKPGRYVMLAVSDDGCGMDKKTLDNAFEPFFTTKKPGEGTGLGLATVYGIVKQNNGFIKVYSEPGMGTVIKIYLPEIQKTTEVKEKPFARKIGKGTETVLVVEDEASVLSLIKAVLEQYGYAVLAARTPSQALEMVECHQGSIHILITDVVMPEMNGKELKERIEQLKPNLKVMFVSGYPSNIIMDRGILERDTHFVQKPFSVDSLVNKVRNVLDESDIAES